MNIQVISIFNKRCGKKKKKQGAAIHETSVNPLLTLKTRKQKKAVCLDKWTQNNKYTVCIYYQDTKEGNPPSPLQQLMLYANVPVLWICYGFISLNIPPQLMPHRILSPFLQKLTDSWDLQKKTLKMVDFVRGAMAFHGKILEVDKQNFQKPSEIKFTNQQKP